MNKKASSTSDLLELLYETWEEIPGENVHHLISSMTNRVLARKNAKVMFAKY